MAHSTHTITGALTPEQTEAGVSAAIEHAQSSHIGVPIVWEPIPETPYGCGQPPAGLLGLALVERITQLAGRGLRVVHAREMDPAATDVVGPTSIAHLRWTASPRADAMIVRARCRVTDSSAALTPTLYLDADTANAATLVGYLPAADVHDVILELHHALTEGAVKTVTINVADRLRVRSLVVYERPRTLLTSGTLFVDRHAFRTGYPIHAGAIAALRDAAATLYTDQQGIYWTWSLDESAAGLVINSSSFVNVLDTSSTGWGWDKRGWVVDAQHRAHGISAQAHATVAVRITTTNATTMRFTSSQGSVDIACAGGLTNSWQVGATKLALASPLDRDIVVVTCDTGGAAATVTGLACEGSTDL